MHIYRGKFNYGEYSKDDLVVLILPHGRPVRNGDEVHIFTHWGKPHGNFNDQNWFRSRTISKVTRAGNDDTFQIADGWWHFECIWKELERISITMIASTGYKMEQNLHLTYESKEDKDDEVVNEVMKKGRIWIGKINWQTIDLKSADNISDEPFILITPEGLGMLAFWVFQSSFNWLILTAGNFCSAQHASLFILANSSKRLRGTPVPTNPTRCRALRSTAIIHTRRRLWWIFGKV